MLAATCYLSDNAVTHQTRHSYAYNQCTFSSLLKVWPLFKLKPEGLSVKMPIDDLSINQYDNKDKRTELRHGSDFLLKTVALDPPLM